MSEMEVKKVRRVKMIDVNENGEPLEPAPTEMEAAVAALDEPAEASREVEKEEVVVVDGPAPQPELTVANLLNGDVVDVLTAPTTEGPFVEVKHEHVELHAHPGNEVSEPTIELEVPEFTPPESASSEEESPDDVPAMQSANDVLSILAGSGSIAEASAKIEKMQADAEDHFRRDLRDTEVSYEKVELSRLVESPTNPRRTFTGIEDLAESIKKMGLLQPLMVRWREGGQYEIVFGHRRFRAAQLAGLREVPVDIRSLTDVQVLEAQLVENVQRADIHPLEEAEGYQRLIDVAGYTAEMLATKTGRSRGWVYQRLKLLALGAEGRKAFLEGKLSLSVAIPLARVPTHKLQAKAVERICYGENEWSARNAIEWLQNEFCVSLRGAPFDRKDDMLVEGAPACIACPKRSGCGTPGLFDDLKGADICTDTTCFNAKSRATWEARAEKMAKQGAEVLGLGDGKKLFSADGNLKHGTPYVSVDQPVHEDEKRRTWAQILEKAKNPPRLVVAPDGEMRPHQLYSADAALAAAAELGISWAKKKTKRVEAAKPEASADEQKLREVRQQVAQEVLSKAAREIKTGAPVPPAMAFQLLAQAVHSTCGESPAAEAFLASVNAKDFDTWVKKADHRALFAYVFVVKLEEWCGGTWTGFDAGLEACAKAFKLDLQAMVASATGAEKKPAPAPKDAKADAVEKAEALFKKDDAKKPPPKPTKKK